MLANHRSTEGATSPSSSSIGSLTLWTAMISIFVIAGLLLAPREPAAQEQSSAQPIASMSVTPNGDVAGVDFQISGEPLASDSSDGPETLGPDAQRPVGTD
jgi:hypothetical protein